MLSIFVREGNCISESHGQLEPGKPSVRVAVEVFFLQPLVDFKISTSQRPQIPKVHLMSSCLPSVWQHTEPPAQKQFIGDAWVGRLLFLFDFHAIQPGWLYGEEGGRAGCSVAVPEGELCGLDGADFMTNGVLPGASCNINGFCSRLVAGGCKGRIGFPVDTVTRTARMNAEVLMSVQSRETG